MIQRIQSIYLLLAMISMLLIFAFPFAKFTVTEPVIFDVNGAMLDGKKLSAIPFLWLTIILAVVSLVTVFLYKNRQLQLKIGRFSYLLHLGYFVTIFFGMNNIQSKIPNGNIAEIAYGIGFYLPIAAIAFIFLANRSIKRDEELVKSVERLRG